MFEHGGARRGSVLAVLVKGYEVMISEKHMLLIMLFVYQLGPVSGARLRA